MISITRIIQLFGRFSLIGILSLAGVSACGRGGERPVDSATAAVEAAERAAEADPMLRNAKVSWEGEKTYDLTGDGQSERLTVKAFGPAYDSLTIVLEIFGPDRALLYRDAWSSGRYFQYDPREGKADTTVARIVTTHLKRVLSDSAFAAGPSTGPNAIIDTMIIRYDLAEEQVRRQHALLDTAMLTIAQREEIEKVTIPDAEVARVAADVKAMPQFTYFAGGELTQTLAWSNQLKRFVRVFECC